MRSVLLLAIIITMGTASEVAIRVGENSVCGIALTLLSPCKDFLVNADEQNIPEDCCIGCELLEKIVRNLKNRRKMKIALCKCLQTDGTQSGSDAGKAFQVIHTCNVTYAPILTGPNVDCTKIF